MVNVIIPCYNSKEVLREALTSLTAQTKKMFTVTVVDDCSTEDIKSVVNEFKDRLHIICLNTPANMGPGAARNRGIEYAIEKKYDYIMFLDADDILNPRAVEVLHSEALKNNADVVFTDIMVEQKYCPPNIIQSQQNITWTHGKIYRVGYLQDKNIRFFEHIRYNEDGAFNTLVFQQTEKTFYIPEIVYIWRDYKNSLTRTKNGDFVYKNDECLVKSMCEVLHILLDTSNSYDISNIVNNLYKHYELHRARGGSIDELKCYIAYAFHREKFDEMFKLSINNGIKFPSLVAINKKDFVYLENSFYQWMKEMGKEYLVKENNECHILK